ncbi:hypothetical protein FSP39_022328 [Pinctada imbricata]|uniref:SGNH hydrolase-type esterase domain-containing protein n=1 Tax=Pinctada imbricata TaxID=66713 RepID=A0AA89C2H2_PINIB|nr:hypothetical protein FSP39_022328 [Pinctada imbricata]
MNKLAIVGHSFVARLEDSLQGSKIRTIFPYGKDLGLDADVKYFGLRGATTKTYLNSREMVSCELFRPTRVFVQVGGNDISKNSTVISVCEGIRDIVEHLLRIDSVNAVIIGSIFPRRKPRGVSEDYYYNEARKINNFLERHYADHSRVYFWKLRGLQLPKKNIFINDGVHLNDDATATYARQIRMALKCDSIK